MRCFAAVATLGFLAVAGCVQTVQPAQPAATNTTPAPERPAAIAPATASASPQESGRLLNTASGPPEAPSDPKVTAGATSVGRLPAEVIQRVVRQEFPRFSRCYDEGLARNPALQGRISVRFVIDRDGSVTNVSLAGSELSDNAVEDCAVKVFTKLTFPKPEGGIVTVVYPIMFSRKATTPPSKAPAAKPSPP